MAVQPESRDPRDHLIDRPAEEVAPHVGATVFLTPKTAIHITTHREPDGSYRTSGVLLGWPDVRRVDLYADLEQLARLHDLLGTYLRQQREMEAESRG